MLGITKDWHLKVQENMKKPSNGIFDFFQQFNLNFSFNEAIAIQPTSNRYYNLGLVYSRLGKTKLAYERLILMYILIFNDCFSFKNCWKLNYNCKDVTQKIADLKKKIIN